MRGVRLMAVAYALTMPRATPVSAQVVAGVASIYADEDDPGNAVNFNGRTILFVAVKMQSNGMIHVVDRI